MTLDRRTAALSLVCLCLNITLLLGQGDQVTVVGTVKDATGGIVPGAEVSLTRTSTNEFFRILTKSTGDFAATGLVPDEYQVRVVMAGFKTEVRSGLRLEVGRTYRMDFELA